MARSKLRPEGLGLQGGACVVAVTGKAVQA
jgi:hypothetical protein